MKRASGWIILGLACVSAAAQTDNAMTLHASATNVVVDVVVMDKDHHPVHGLRKTDFIVAEDKKPQAISAFDEHVGQTTVLKMPKMPPGVFTNFMVAPANAAVNVLLIDFLNTPLEDQSYLKDQILKFVNGRQPSNVAVFGLGVQLRMLQGFSSDPDILKAVVNKQFGKASPLLADQLGGSGVADSISDVMSEPAQSLMPADVVAAMQTLEDLNKELTLEIRAKYTLSAMNELARYLASIPGRKNLIWFSGSFPINMLPAAVATGANDHFASVGDTEPEYKETSSLLSKAEVAVYPIDARGMQASPVFTAAAAGSRYAPARGGAANVNKDELNFFSDQASEHGTMARMAEDTGGRAFYNTNDLAGAITQATEDGSNYYTLAYSPTNSKEDGEFRRIEVKVEHPGYTVSYRRGYFADKAKERQNIALLAEPSGEMIGSSASRTPSAPSGARSSRSAAAASPVQPISAQKAMVHGVPPSTQILYKVLIQPASGTLEDKPAPQNVINRPGFAPAKAPFRRYIVAFAASPNDVEFTTTKDGVHEANLEFVSIVYQADGQLVNTRTDSIKARFTPAEFDRLMHSGLSFDQEISVPDKGDYYIRTAVYDPASNRLGSVETSVAAVKGLPPAASAVAQPPE
jgi:VWFA-related protein